MNEIIAVHHRAEIKVSYDSVDGRVWIEADDAPGINAPEESQLLSFPLEDAPALIRALGQLHAQVLAQEEADNQTPEPDQLAPHERAGAR